MAKSDPIFALLILFMLTGKAFALNIEIYLFCSKMLALFLQAVRFVTSNNVDICPMHVMAHFIFSTYILISLSGGEALAMARHPSATAAMKETVGDPFNQTTTWVIIMLMFWRRRWDVCGHKTRYFQDFRDPKPQCFFLCRT